MTRFINTSFLALAFAGGIMSQHPIGYFCSGFIAACIVANWMLDRAIEKMESEKTND